MKSVYFLGIGGVSMSALAIMLQQKGYIVAGSDEMQSKMTEMLKEHNIEVDFNVNEEKIKGADVVVYSSAIKQYDPRFQLAKKYNKKIMTRGELLGKIASEYEKVIAVSGSHGKTTTTALIYNILKCAGMNPTLHLGGFLTEEKRNFVFGGQEYFVTEACEYCDNFLKLYPYIGVVTNVEKEHMDYFKTFERQLMSYAQFKKQSNIVIEGCKNFRAKYKRHNKNGSLSFSLYNSDEKIMKLNLNICEDVNSQNCIYAYQVAKQLGISDSIIKLGLESFKGVSRRFEKVKCEFFDTVIVDYAHHPTEIKKAIQSMEKIYKNKKLVVLFQPHTYSRTKSLYGQFVSVFKNLEYPIWYKTYSAREQESEGMSAENFIKNLKKYNKNAKYFEKIDNLETFLKTFSKDNTVLLVVGAGDLPSELNKIQFIS